MTSEQLKQEILKLKADKNITVLAHVYQHRDILEVADVTGDSFALAKAAEKIDSDTVIMCGVSFMAETVKILSPKKTVILPEPNAGCPMAEMLSPSHITDFTAEHPDYMVAAYINTTSELKAVSDVCVTSSSAVKILSTIDHDKFLFIPDKNLGAYVAEQLPDKKIVTMNGYCPTHDRVTADDIFELKDKYPTAPVAAHPECRSSVLELADFVGATTQITSFAEKQEGDVIIVTEMGVCDYLNHKYNTNRFIQAAPDKLICPNMKATTLNSLYNALNGTGGCEIELDEELRLKAKVSIDNMLKYGG